ncbi:DUF1707 SHOCT-like domain-containing protein [Nocardia macrotermitis]|uniref:DUF1707 domain-containing protein n=1 Tax=Nocardia macrotermitis TaxID=2585198 RepID=A0A7K0DE21_9NOCA|nr:DUF1707 domain-containing protein [Nocardia macrotermitis]MQY24050.1 hypothetical protein [Nocardia macrotermitis]
MHTSGPTPSGRPGSPARTANRALRVRDSDRVDACAVLDAACGDGQLTELEHAERTRIAMRAGTFAQLDAVLDDLQIPANLVDRPATSRAHRRPARRWLRAGAFVAAVALIGMLCGWVSSDDGPVASHRTPDMTTAAGLESFLTTYRAHFGDLLADEVVLHPDTASIERPAAGDPSKSERTWYRDKFSSGSTTSRKPDLQPLDLGKLDLAKLAALLAGAAQSVGAPGNPISHIIIDRSGISRDAPPAVSIYVGGAVSGYLMVDFTGEPLYISKASR